MKTPLERILDVAQRLDEMVEEGPSELTTLSDELGKAVAALEDAPRSNQVPQSRPQPRWAQELRRMVEQAAVEIIDERYGEMNRGYSDPNDPYITLRIPRNDYRYSGRGRDREREEYERRMMAYSPQIVDTRALLRGINAP